MNKISAMMAIRTTAIPPYNKFFTNSMLTIQYPSFSGSLAFVFVFPADHTRLADVRVMPPVIVKHARR